MKKKFDFATPKVVTQQLCSFKDMEQSGTAIIRLKHQRKGKAGRFSFRSYQDPETGIVYGIPISLNPDGTHNFKRITIQDGYKMYNLANESEAMEFYVVKNCPFTEGTKVHFGWTPNFVVEYPEKDAKLRISERKQGREAETTIDAMNDHEIKELGMIFNINTDHNTVEMIKDILLERCIKYPIKMHTLINNKEETAIRITIKRCIRTGILQEETGTGIKTSDGYIIGLNENMAIQTLKEDKDLLYRLDKESKARTGNNKKAETPESVTKPIKETNTVTN